MGFLKQLHDIPESRMKKTVDSKRIYFLLKVLSSRQGLTFVEVLLASAMVAVIAAAVYGMLANGIKVWQKVNTETTQVDINILCSRLELDLKNCIKFPDIAFEGDISSFSFPAIISQSAEENDFSEQVGRVSYFFDAAVRSVTRKYTDYRQLRKSGDTPARPLLNEVDFMGISYYFYDAEKQVFLWSSEWPPEELKEGSDCYPHSVCVSLLLRCNQTVEKRSKTIDIPIGGLAD